MNQAIQDEVLAQLALDIAFGFENETQLFDSISDMFYNEPDFDTEWLRQTIATQYRQHQQESLNWKRPTDFDRLAKAFDQLIAEKIVCLHNAGYTKQDGEADCRETIENLQSLGITAIGFCYYHTQDLARAVDPDIQSLYLGFDSVTGSDAAAIEVAHRIISVLKAHQLEVSWPGKAAQRIEIQNIHWQKTPDDENWGAARVIQILTANTAKKKPFWKLW